MYCAVVAHIICLLNLNLDCRLEEATGLTFRFIIGKTSAEWKMSVLRKEVAQHDDFILLDIVEEYSKLPYKTLVLIFSKCVYSCVQLVYYLRN